MDTTKTPRRQLTIDGLPVYDADEPLVIEVIKEHIRRRFRRDPAQCAIAQACKDAAHTTDALAYLSRVYVKNGDHWLRYEMPEMARAEVKTYDQGGGFSEGVYILRPRPERQRSGGDQQGGNRKPTGTGSGNKPFQQPRGHRVVTGIRNASPLHGGALEQFPKKLKAIGFLLMLMSTPAYAQGWQTGVEPYNPYPMQQMIDNSNTAHQLQQLQMQQQLNQMQMNTHMNDLKIQQWFRDNPPLYQWCSPNCR